jgi:hypothetical protein
MVLNMAKFINKLKLYCLDKGKTEEEFNTKVQCQNDNDGKGDWISHWDLVFDKPTEEQLNALESEATKLENNAKVDATRRTSYGSWNDQLDEIYHDIDAWKARLQTIKTNNPKS